jgi:Trichohyalin-plectin-homology domain
MMEIERLKVLKLEEEREAKKAELRIKGKQVIVDQIQDRTLQRMKEQEIRDKERIQLLEHIEKMKKEEEIQQEEKRRQINLLIQQAAEANQQALI